MHTLKRMGLWAHENSAPHWFRNFPRTRRTYQQTVYYTFLLFSLVIFLENYKTLLVDQSFISWYLFYTFGQLNSSAKNGKRKIDCLFLLLYFALFPYQTRPSNRLFNETFVHNWIWSLRNNLFFRYHQQVQTVILKKICATGKQTRNGSFALIKRD